MTYRGAIFNQKGCPMVHRIKGKLSFEQFLSKTDMAYNGVVCPVLLYFIALLSFHKKTKKEKEIKNAC